MTDIEKRALKVFPRLTGCDYITESSQGERRFGYIKACKEYESLPKVHGWVACDFGKVPNFHEAKPYRIGGLGYWENSTGNKICCPYTLFPNLTWESEPVEVELLIRKK